MDNPLRQNQAEQLKVKIYEILKSMEEAENNPDRKIVTVIEYDNVHKYLKA